jgi:hypothetical protein
LLLVGLALLAALGGYTVCYRWMTGASRSMLAGPDAGMQWLRQEYHLTETQFVKVQDLHRQYTPKCEAMCDDINKANAHFREVLKKNARYSPEVDAALAECASVQASCRHALLQHAYAVSAEMSPEEGRRYLGMMAVRVIEPGMTQESLISQSPK